MIRCAVLDENNVLIGCVEKTKMLKKDIDIGDLPTDATYKYVNYTFIPVGFGKGKPRASKYSRDEILAMLIESIHQGRHIPSECMDWVKHLKSRG